MSLNVKDLHYTLAKQTLLQDINFQAKKGEVVGIIGPNGAGKSTLLKHIAAILPIKKEQIMLDGKDISKLKPREISRHIAYLSQFASFPQISVLESLELGRRSYSGMMLSQLDKEMISQSIEEFDLHKLLHRSIDTLSGGERQKVMIASAMLQEPDVLLLDEPISHLDPKNQLEMLSAIHKVTYEKNLVTLVVLHDLQHAIHYCDSLLMLKLGEIKYHIKTDMLEEKMLEELFDIQTKLYYVSGHIFVYYGHHH
ncbi:ABC transporter ATP-binding protein [Sulfurospirillum arcachonense]|uniref:ABC transporter ATP-binding protein n=1 Tax=Sulfurospirillum arcachonense TaxID=57666 RepID=UPI000469C5DB|nr:ABC transporter ATP-binding protein [Sulfurospirillum arcachonense]